MKYFRVRRRRGARTKNATVLSEAIANTHMLETNDKVGADYLPVERFSADFQEQTPEQSIQGSNHHTEKERNRCKERLFCARRSTDIRLTRKEVSCLQVLVETVLSEHLVLSRELQAVNERMGLPEPCLEARTGISPLARNVERLQSVLERDATRLKAALRDRDERLEGAFTEAAALKLELEKWRRESADETEKQQAALEHALTERDNALEASAEKDEVISDLRSKIANLKSKRSNEALSMSRALTDKEIVIKKLESQAQKKAADWEMLHLEYNANAAMLEMERTARHSSDNNLESLLLELRRTQEDHEETVIMLSTVLSDKEAEMEDLRKQLEDAKHEFEDDCTKIKRSAETEIASMKQTSDKEMAQKMVELRGAQKNLKETQAEVQRVMSQLGKEMDKASVVRGELAAARNELAKTKETVSNLKVQLAEERGRCEEQMQVRETLEAQLRSFRSEADKIQTDLETRLSKLQEKASVEKSNMERQLASIEKNLREAETVASRIPTFESNLKAANAEIHFLKEELTERNAELAAKQREANQHVEEVKRTKQEMEVIRLEKEKEARKLREKLESVKAKREEEASHFREALHEKDLEIRERQDRLKQIEHEHEAIQNSLSSVQKTLEDATQKHKSSMANARQTYRETLSLQKETISKKSDEIKALQDSVKTLQSKMTDQRRQHSQEVDKLKASWEKTKNSLEKTIREKESALKESEGKRTSLNADLSEALSSKEVIFKELERVREELDRTVKIICEAKAETRLALETMADTERTMFSIYADSIGEKIAYTETQLKVDELEKKWLDAKEEVDKRDRNYARLKIRFVKYIKIQLDEMKAAGDSVDQNRADAKRYFDELESSRTELANSEVRCKTLKSHLESALQKIESLSDNENSLLAQAEQNKQLLTLAETEVRGLKSDLDRQRSDLNQLKDELVKKESLLDVVSADLERERALSAKQSAECQDAFALIESVSRERGVVLDPEVKLPQGVDMLPQNIRCLETQQEELCQQLTVIKHEHDALKEELSFKTAQLKERELTLTIKDESVEKLQSELTDLLREMSEQRNKVAEMETYLEEILNNASDAFKAQETLRNELEEGKYFLRDANSRIDLLTSQLEHERSRVAELQQEIFNTLEIKNCYQQELDEKSLSIQHLSNNLSRLESELHLKEVLSKTLEERTDESGSLQERLIEQEREVSRLLSLLELAHQECECKAHHESADGDGNKETHSDGLKELKSALAERDMDVAKLRSVIVDLQAELSANKSTSDGEVASYRFQVEELSNEITTLRRQLKEQELDMRNSSEQTKLDLHWTAEQTRLGGRQDVSRLSPRRRPGAPGGAPLKRTVSEGDGGWETDTTEWSPLIQIPVTNCTDALS